MVEKLAATSEESPLALWRIPLDRETEVDEDWLSDEEKSFAQGFRDVLLRGRFLAARRGVRRVLGAETGVRPREIGFASREHGKPYVVNPRNGPDFNLTHTENVALLAVSRCGPVGVDIENVHRTTDILHLAPRVMTEGEHEVFVSLEPERQRSAFFHLWTAKEALMKVTGLGLGLDPRKIETDPLLGFADRVEFRVEDSRMVASQWCARKILAGDPYVGFLAFHADSAASVPEIQDLPAAVQG